MRASTLRQTLNPARLIPFDYAALGNAEVERQLREAALRIHELQRVAAIDIGRTLLSVKDSLPFGSFLEWVEAEFPFGRRTAANMMQVATAFGDRWESVSHLPTTVLYKLAAPSTPSAVRDAVLDLPSDEIVTPRGVRAAIEAAKKADQRKSAPKREEREAQQAAEAAQRQERLERDQAKREAEKEAAADAAERVRFMLGGYFPEMVELLETLDLSAFSQALKTLVEEFKAKREQEGLNA